MMSRSQGPAPGQNLAAPDVCNTPAIVPVPIPYPNTAMTTMAVPTIPNQLIMGMPAHNLMTMGTISMGDNAGVLGGVVSGMFMGPYRHLMGSMKVIKGPAPATRMLDPTGQNGMMPNALGVAISPSQPKEAILS